MDDNAKKLRLLISSCGFVAFVLHQFFPAFKLDAIGFGLIVVILLPWLSPLFKTIEIAGIGKVEFQQVKEKLEQVEEKESITKEGVTLEVPLTEMGVGEYSFLSSENPQVALVGLRIELEKKLRTLAVFNQLPVKKHQGAFFILMDLQKAGILSDEEVSIIRQVINILNRAAHGIEITPAAIELAYDIGPRVLKLLDKKLPQAKR